VLAVVVQQQTTPMVLMVVILFFLPLHQQAVVAAVVLTHQQVQVAVLAVVAVKLELLAAQEIRQAQVHHRETMAETQAEPIGT